jgi:hypothetical protein
MISVLICANLQVVLQCHLKITWQFQCMLSYQIIHRWSSESAVTENCIMVEKLHTNLSEEYTWKNQKHTLVIWIYNFIFILQYRSTRIRTEDQSQKYDYNRGWHTRLSVCNSYLSHPSLNNHSQLSWCMLGQMTVQISSSVAYSCRNTMFGKLNVFVGIVFHWQGICQKTGENTRLMS